MKTLLTIFFSIALCAGMAQTIRRVNNNPGISGTNVYSTFAAAHTAAAANDIIIIEPSNDSYGDILLTKPLKIYGNGYFLNSTQKADLRPTSFVTVEFNTGSGGSEVYGVTAVNFYIYGVSNVTLSRNYVQSIINLYNRNKAATTNTNISNIFINKNFFTGYVNTNPVAGFTFSNVLVNNNILYYITANSDPSIQNWVVRNNTFTTSSANLTLVNSVLENNFFTAGGGSPGLANVTSSYNISTGTSFPAGIGNQANYDIVTDPPWLGGTNDAAYQIKPGDPLKTKGNGGIEVGAFGGSTPYILSGIPAIPSVVSMVNSGTGDNTNPVKVTITVKSNN